jgi:host factor-I protein
VNNKPPNLQDAFLNQMRRENMPLTMYLVNGVQVKGAVRGFDSFTVVLEGEGRQMMVYKHAISTIIPLRPINLQQATAAEGAEQ